MVKSLLLMSSFGHPVRIKHIPSLAFSIARRRERLGLLTGDATRTICNIAPCATENPVHRKPNHSRLQRQRSSSNTPLLKPRLGPWYSVLCICISAASTWWIGRVINGGSAELKGGATVYLYGIEAFALARVVHYTTSQGCTMAVSEADCGFDAGCVRRHELYAGASKPSTAI